MEVHGFEGGALEHAQVVEQPIPMLWVAGGAVDQGIGCCVVQASGTAEADAPLGLKSLKQLESRPVFWPDFNGLFLEVFRREA